MHEDVSPRILFQDVPKELLSKLIPLAGTSGVVEGQETATVHASDWDLVVSFSWRPYMGAGTSVLSFGGSKFPLRSHEGIGQVPERNVTLHARGLAVPEDLPGPMRSLIQRSIIDNDPGASNREGIGWRPFGSVSLVTAGAEKRVWAALLSYPEKQYIFALPKETTEHVAWLATVLRFMNHHHPDRYPGEPDWREKDEWWTPATRQAHETLRTVEAERAAALEAFDARSAAAREAIDLASKGSESGALRLLTEQGEQLVQAVTDALIQFGFEVRDMDEHHDEKTGAKLEDLRVIYPPGSQSWTCLAEVKGYGKGAKANDVAQILSRPPLVFLKEEGREPEGLWHIVNSNREQDPSARPRALTSGGDLVALAKAGGCFIDTRDLFRAWRDVEDGTATAEEVRSSLMAGRERWEWPAKGSGS